MYVRLFIVMIPIISCNDITENIMRNSYYEFGMEKDSSCGSCFTNGGWTTWNKWGSCMGECGSTGRKMRSRSCTNPSPSENGMPCIGPDHQITTCQITGCTIADYEKSVCYDPVRKKVMKLVNAVHAKLPALIELCFSANCAFTIVEQILGNDAMVYWNAMNCVKYGVGCPRAGGWSSWKTWSPCTALCGKGQRYRERFCNNPKPSELELDCNGLAYEIENCSIVNCKKYLSGTWNNWSPWKYCSAHCGSGIKVRTRSCIENQQKQIKRSSKQDTSCEGSVKEIKHCEITQCSVDGAWSQWTAWTTCSFGCGVGAQSRNRMCNNPSPSGTGAICPGSATEVRQCFIKPCSVRTHEVASFSGDSQLTYSMQDRQLHLLHIYLRFLPLTSFGVLFHRYESNCDKLNCDSLKLILQNGRIAFLAEVSDCTLTLISEEKLEVGRWHEILVVFCRSYVILRINDGIQKIAFLSCTPVSLNLDHLMNIGEGLQGQIQTLVINFKPIQFRLPKTMLEHEKGYIPVISNRVNYVMGDDEEGFVHVRSTDSLIAPCPKRAESWRVTIVIKPEDVNGVITMIPGDILNNYILLILEDGHVTLYFHQGIFRTKVESARSVLVGEWLEIVITRNQEKMYIQINGDKKSHLPSIPEKVLVSCTGGIYIGVVSNEMKEQICPKCMEVPQMNFILGLLDIDENQIDLLSLPVIETTSKHFYSRTVSFSERYKEISLPLGKELKLSCFYDKIVHEQKVQFPSVTNRHVIWLLMDKPLYSDDFYTLKDNGRISSISVASYLSHYAVEGFYSCYTKYVNNMLPSSPGGIIFTFGVAIIDENAELNKLSRKQWIFISKIVASFVIFLLLWLLFEVLCDLKNGYGFYRLPRKNKCFESMMNFLSSADAIILLGSQQAVNEIMTKITEEYQIRNTRSK